MEQQQWMEHEWTAQVTTQEEEAEWLPSLAQQKLHPRPQNTKGSSIKIFVLYTLVYLCNIFTCWLILGHLTFFLIGNIGLVEFLAVGIGVSCLGMLLLLYAEGEQRSNMTKTHT